MKKQSELIVARHYQHTPAFSLLSWRDKSVYSPYRLSYIMGDHFTARVEVLRELSTFNFIVD